MSSAGLEAPSGWRRLRPGSAEYPRLLARIPAPPALVVRGRLDPDAPMVAVVGARRSSAYGEGLAYEIAMQLVSAGVAVVSGLARGIDAAAHRGALDGGGATVAVMGTGPDQVYPPEHRELAERIATGGGALVSQFPTGTSPLPHNFPVRNETISGLSLGVVVVEARRRSGAMLTAGAAGNQGRTVMAVPGSVHNAASQGCHDLIRDQAVLVTGARDILAEVGSDSLLSFLDVSPAGARGPGHGDARDPVLEALRTGTMTLDDIAAAVDLPGTEVVTAVARLRLDGEIRLRDGSYGLVARAPARPLRE